uniref:Uncharacterized protein n=1 Tax=Vibrio genomosp. F6 TaxID=723172 RepID=A0A0H3ZTP8_9VIBR|nr:hypothetical protein [Vibrio genomosp. F6]
MLDSLEGIESFLPDPGISPVQLLKMKGKIRQRVNLASTPQQPKEEDLDW